VALMLRRLDRYFLIRASGNAALLLAGASLLYVLFDLTLKLDKYLKYDLPEGQNRLLTVIGFYLYNLPEIIGILLPAAVVGGVLFSAARSLANREFIAVTSAGVSMRQACRGLLLVAVLAAMLDLLLIDQVVPRTLERSDHFSGFIGNQEKTACIWRDPETKAIWYGHRGRLGGARAPSLELVAIAPLSGGLVVSCGLVWQGDWHLQQPVVTWNGGDDVSYRVQQNVPMEGELTCSLSPDQLRQELISRHAQTAWQLWDRGDQLHRSLVYARLSHLFLTPLMVLAALPMLLRFVHIGALVGAGLRAFALGCWPLLCMTIANRSAEVSVLGALPTVLLGLLLGGLPGVLLWWRWRL
jgi:lipopolysaccharide export LptBFGC system permease protein LptF